MKVEGEMEVGVEAEAEAEVEVDEQRVAGQARRIDKGSAAQSVGKAARREQRHMPAAPESAERLVRAGASLRSRARAAAGSKGRSDQSAGRTCPRSSRP